MAMLAGAFGLGTIIGPAIAPLFVLPVISFAGPMFAFAAMAGAMYLWARRGLPDEEIAPVVEPEAEKTSRWAAFRGDLSLWRDPRVTPFLIYSFLIASCQTVMGQTLGFVIIDRLNLAPIAAQGYTAVAMMAGAVAGLLAQWGFIRMFQLGPRMLMRLGAGLAALASLITALAPDYWTVVIGYTLASLGFAFARPGFSAGLSLAVRPDEQARAAGAISAINGGNVIFAPLIGILLYQYFRPAPFLMNMIVLCAMLAFAYWSKALSSAGAAPATEEDATAAAFERRDEGGSV
jgi:MFS family permease